METVRVGVIGCGYMGKNHLRILATLPNVVLVGISDVERGNRDWAAKTYQVLAFETSEELIADKLIDAVIVAVPTKQHFSVAKRALEEGKHVLVEKPIAASAKEGKVLLGIAERMKRVFVVGHTERYNPMVQILKEHLQKKTIGKLLQIRIRRLSPYPGRKQEVGVLMDLATHDLDVLFYLLGSYVKKYHAFYRNLRSRTFEDVAVLILTLANGIVATINVSWVTLDKVRDIAIEGDRGMLIGNYLSQELKFFSGYVPGFLGADVPVRRSEPLVLELKEFIRRITHTNLERSDVLSSIAAVGLIESILERGVEE